MPSVALLAISVLAASALLTGLVQRLAAGSGLLDVPNPRSSHGVPTPRGGGVAIVLVTTAGLLVLALHGTVRWDLLYALAGGGLAVALVGFVDDRRSVPAPTRLIVHFAAALWALGWLGGLPPLSIGSHLVLSGWTGYALGAFGIVWAVNLFNFMDGIDGIAASEATCVTWCGALLTTAATPASAGLAHAAVILGAACLGFLCWNWPPARVFMGDVGSGYVGYLIGVLALAATRDNPAAIWIWLILGGVFFVDATVTLARRVLRGERVHEPHRTHAYQWLARRWGSHGRVTLTVIAINLLWLLPWATLAALRPEYALAAVLLALAPLLAIALATGAGRPEGDQSPS